MNCRVKGSLLLVPAFLLQIVINLIFATVRIFRFIFGETDRRVMATILFNAGIVSLILVKNYDRNMTMTQYLKSVLDNSMANNTFFFALIFFFFWVFFVYFIFDLLGRFFDALYFIMENLISKLSLVYVCLDYIKYGYNSEKEKQRKYESMRKAELLRLNPNYELNGYIKKYGREYVRDNINNFNHPAIDTTKVEPIVFDIPEDIEDNHK